ncbi:hypothetical protein [Peteryoungia ipomoeae]|uniref:hypothetical protein n=1 Tax=Peteryoungia ipomoeae TaxID=1210932 RepID=UPI0014562D1B|nr:hypothetical protein [Peteryoungia ipomoeae]
MSLSGQSAATHAAPSLRSVAVLVFSAKIAVAAFLVSQVMTAPQPAAVHAYGLDR